MPELLYADMVMDVLFYQRPMSDALLLTVRKHFAYFKTFITQDSLDAAARPARERMVLRFIGERMISLETLRTSSVFESSAGHLQNPQQRQLNNAFITTSTSFHSLDQLFGRLQAADKQGTLNALRMGYKGIVGALSSASIGRY